jgi:serine/threonine-protein kinase
VATERSAGDEIGPYRLLHRVGKGGMGEVWAAESSGRIVALKILAVAELGAHRAALFLDEARNAASVSHPAIVRALDFGRAGDALYLAMDLIRGPSLRALLDRLAQDGTLLPPRAVCYIGERVASALEHAHSSIALIHRDVSPPNILLDLDGDVFLTDFGVARSSIQTHESRLGTIRGKPSYMSPEQTRGAALDARTDLFSLGVVLYETATLERLFRRETEIESMEAVLRFEPEPLDRRLPGFPEPVWLAIRRLLEKQPEDRPETAAAAARELEGAGSELEGVSSGREIVSALVRAVFPAELFDPSEAAKRALETPAHVCSTASGSAESADRPTIASAMPAAMGDAGAGRQFGKYRLVSPLGVGGLGEVFLARERDAQGLDRWVAIKRLLPHLAASPEFVARFRREAILAAQLAHANIVPVYEFGEVDGAPYLAMEFVDGGNLRSVVDRAHAAGLRLSLPLAVHVCAEIAAALEYAHAKSDTSGHPLGIIHRDVSPQNVLISRHGEVKLADFGLAHVEARGTFVGPLFGKVAYMPPEQASSGEVDARSDLYALGAMFFELATGQLPFEECAKDASPVDAIHRRTAPRPRDIDPELPPAVDDLVAIALARQPERRFPDARTMRLALRTISRGIELDGAVALSDLVREVLSPASAPINATVASGLAPLPSTLSRARPLGSEQRKSKPSLASRLLAIGVALFAIGSASGLWAWFALGGSGSMPAVAAQPKEEGTSGALGRAAERAATQADTSSTAAKSDEHPPRAARADAKPTPLRAAGSTPGERAKSRARQRTEKLRLAPSRDAAVDPFRR